MQDEKDIKEIISEVDADNVSRRTEIIPIIVQTSNLISLAARDSIKEGNGNLGNHLDYTRRVSGYMR